MKEYLTIGLTALLSVTFCAKANPPPSEWQLIAPEAAGVASGSSYFPMEGAFDGSVAWDGTNAMITGTAGSTAAPPYPDRYGYIDFGTNFARIHIMECWSRYISWSGGSQPGYAEMWWDDDTDTVNDNGTIETRLNFNSGQALPNLSTEIWFRDLRVNQLGGVIPQQRYLILKSTSTYAGRAQEYAMAGYLYDGLVPPEYEDALFLNIDTNNVAENQNWKIKMGIPNLTGGRSNEIYSLRFDETDGDNRFFRFDGTNLWTHQSFDYEAQASYILNFDAVDSATNLTPLELVIYIDDIAGKWDQNGIADAEVAAAYPEINEGDCVLWNATNSDGPTIYYANNSFFSVTPPNKILIKAGIYSHIQIDLSSVNGTGASNRVPICNFLGQVYSEQIELANGSYWRLTGQYDPLNGFGHADFPGCDTETGSTDFGFSNGRFGFWFSNEWKNEIRNMIKVYGTATGYEIDHVEVCDGGFAGMLLKHDNRDAPDMDNLYLHHLYIHDTGSEGIYLGSTQSDPQHQFNHLTIEKVVILRAGTEALQVGQLGDQCLIQNSVFWGAIDWLSPFQRWQDNCVQVSTRQGGTTFRNNILLAGAEKFYNVSNIPKPSITPSGNPNLFENNLNWSCRGGFGAYQLKQTDGMTDWIWSENFWGNYDFQHDLVYTSAQNTRTCILVATDTINVTTSNNVFDATCDRLAQTWASSSATLTQSNNVQKTVLPPPFLNLLGSGVTQDLLRWNRWTAKIGESGGFSDYQTNKGQPVTFQPGDIVQHPANGTSRYYQCLQTNTEHEPPADGDEYWKLLIWKQGSHQQLIPPDDVRLVEGSIYHRQGIGLRGNGLKDSDNDNLPDDWEIRFGLNPAEDDSQADPDQDGINNLDEYFGNTHPTQPSPQHPLVLTPQTTNLLVRFLPPAGRTWQLEQSTTLTNWTPIQQWQISNNETNIIQTDMNADHAFLRLRIDSDDRLDLLP